MTQDSATLTQDLTRDLDQYIESRSWPHHYKELADQQRQKARDLKAQLEHYDHKQLFDALAHSWKEMRDERDKLNEGKRFFIHKPGVFDDILQKYLNQLVPLILKGEEHLPVLKAFIKDEWEKERFQFKGGAKGSIKSAIAVLIRKQQDKFAGSVQAVVTEMISDSSTRESISTTLQENPLTLPYGKDSSVLSLTIKDAVTSWAEKIQMSKVDDWRAVYSYRQDQEKRKPSSSASSS